MWSMYLLVPIDPLLLTAVVLWSPLIIPFKILQIPYKHSSNGDKIHSLENSFSKLDN